MKNELRVFIVVFSGGMGILYLYKKEKSSLLKTKMTQTKNQTPLNM